MHKFTTALFLLLVFGAIQFSDSIPQPIPQTIDVPRVGIQIRNMKMVFNFYCIWHWVTFEKLMMKINDFFYSAKSFSHPI